MYEMFLCDITNNLVLCGWMEPYFLATEPFGANTVKTSKRTTMNSPTREFP